MKRILSLILLITLIFSICGCEKEAKKLPVKVLIVPHFEINEMKGDNPGEAQLFFEEYFEKYDEYTTTNGTTLFYNDKNEVALFMTGVGKVNAAMSTTSILSDSRFDFSNAYILAVGCAGSAVGYSTLGDVIIESAICDYDLGHTADIRDMNTSDAKVWFPSSEYDESGCKKLNTDTVARAYALTKDVKLKTTDNCRKILSRNFNDEAWAVRDPSVIKGTSITSDNYWKGKYNHEKALQITEYYECPDPYASTEMEDLAIAIVADQFGLLDKTLVLRVAVNIDEFFDDASPESLWGQTTDFINEVSESNEETLDIFGPGMENIFVVGKAIIDSILCGNF